jgi:membrane-associated protein
MDLVETAWLFLTHLDVELGRLLQTYGTWVYAILFAIVFCETGLVVAPFLPGDSLLFVAGALWPARTCRSQFLMATLMVAALCGDNCNYWIGRALSSRARHWKSSRFFNRKLFDRTEAFYAKHGGKTVILARFVPLVRTFAPFVAGVGRMSYARFLVFSVIGAVLWVGVLVPARLLVRQHRHRARALRDRGARDRRVLALAAARRVPAPATPPGRAGAAVTDPP